MERLIEEVRQRRVLWDTSVEEYRHADLKDKAWDEVASNMGKDKLTVKNEWRKLKDCHRQAVNRKKTKSGQAASKIKPWKFEMQMEFMLAGMIPRDRNNETNVPPLDDNNTDVNNDETFLEDEVNDEMVDMPQGEEDSNETTTSSSSRKRPPRGTDKVLNYLQNKEQRKRSAPVGNELDLFFASVCKTTRRLPRHLQIRIKRDVMSSLLRAEEENELVSSSTSSSLTPSPMGDHSPSVLAGHAGSSQSTYFCPDKNQQYHCM